MLSMKKTALLAAIATLALGLTPDAARAGGGRHYDRAQAHQGAKSRVFHKASYRRDHKAGRGSKAVRSHYRRWRGNSHRWSPPRKYHRKYRREYRRKYRQWDRRRYYGHTHKYWRPHRHGGGNQLFGTVIGAALGAVIGSSVSNGHDSGAIIVGGAVVGGIIGNQIGRSMDQADHHHVMVVLETTRTGEPVEWANPDNGTRYTLTPTRTYRNARGEDCRDYTVWGWIDGYEEKLHGTACRTDDGRWRTVT